MVNATEQRRLFVPETPVRMQLRRSYSDHRTPSPSPQRTGHRDIFSHYGLPTTEMAPSSPLEDQARRDDDFWRPGSRRPNATPVDDLIGRIITIPSPIRQREDEIYATLRPLFQFQHASASSPFCTPTYPRERRNRTKKGNITIETEHRDGLKSSCTQNVH